MKFISCNLDCGEWVVGWLHGSGVECASVAFCAAACSRRRSRSISSSGETKKVCDNVKRSCAQPRRLRVHNDITAAL